MRCWGLGSGGRLGYGNTASIGNDETPGSVGPVDLGLGRTAVRLTAGAGHTCAVLDDATTRCWGIGSFGRLGYAATANIGDDEVPGSVGPVDVGAGRTAVDIAAGGRHTSAALDDGAVRCWGLGTGGRLGYANTTTIGDDETPGSVAPVRIGPRRTATRIAAGWYHSSAVLDDATVRCWGVGGYGGLGYGNIASVNPAEVGPVDLGPNRTATEVAAGALHTCAVLDDGHVRCWGDGSSGALGYGNTAIIGDDETPASVSPVNLGPGRTAVQVAAGVFHTCVIMEDGSVRCWGSGADGRLGYGNTDTLGDDETPASIGGGRSGPRPYRRADRRRRVPHLRPAGRRHRAVLGQWCAAGQRHARYDRR